MQLLFIESNGSPYAWSVKSISVVKEYNLKRDYKSRREAKYDNIRG